MLLHQRCSGFTLNNRSPNNNIKTYKNPRRLLYLHKKVSNSLSTHNLPVLFNLVLGRIYYSSDSLTNCLRFLNADMDRLKILKVSKGKSGIYM